jgi:hypothetical protein
LLSLLHNMSLASSFTYSECFSLAALSRTPERLKLRGVGDPELLLLVRLLSGAIKVEHVGSSKSFHQKENYFSSDFKNFSQRWNKFFPQLIGEDYTSENFAHYIENTKFQNRSFYKNILSELSYYFHYQNKKNHTSSFVFLYRALEHVSYAFPLIYASRTVDFTRSYKFLKELMNGDKNAGELGFFKRFIEAVYSDDAIKESSIDFPIHLETETEQKKAFNLLRSLCKDNMIAESTENPRLLSVKYVEVGSFIVTIRNRFFHNMNGGASNIEMSKVTDVDELFSLVNKKFLYWLSTLLLAVISHNANEFENIKRIVT